MNANSNSPADSQRISKFKVHSPIKLAYKQIDEIKSKIKQEKQKINYNKIKKENDHMLEEKNTYLRKKEEHFNEEYKLIKDKNNNKIVTKGINETKINKNKMIPSLNDLKSGKKSGIKSESDFDKNLKIYQKSNIKINNTENTPTINKISIIYF